MSDATLTFGEIVPQSFLQILNYTADPAKFTGRNFVDLGSGTGRACICAALSPYGFSEVTGIELMPDLCDQSNAVHGRLLEMIEKPVPDCAVVSKPKVSEKNAHAPDLDSVAVQVLINSAHAKPGIPLDLFANLITKQMGHKVFKVAVKQHQTFAKYLKKRDNLFELSEDGKYVSSKTSACNDVADVELSQKVESLRVDEEEVEEPSTSELTLTVMQDAATSTTTEQDDYVFQLTESDVKLLSPLPRITIHQGDMFAHDWWRDADVVYAASLLFSEAMMQTLTVQVSWMKPGAWMVSLKPLLLEQNADQLRSPVVLRSESFYKMSWQMAKVYIYQVL